MPPTGSTFTDWQQVEQESRLLMNEDFSWSEPPQRRRRRITEEPIRAHRRAAAPDPHVESQVHEAEAWDQPTAAHSHFDEMMEQWNAQYGDAAEYGGAAEYGDPADRAFDLSDPGVQAAGQSGRRTVLITGRGDDRYMPAPRRSRSSELRFHERSTFSPDRAALWAVLLSIALVIGAIAH